MSVKFVNFFKSKIADVGGIGSGDTEFTLSSGDGANLPTLTGGHHCYLVFVDVSSNREVVKVTAVVSDTCTIVRGQDGTTPRAFAQDDLVELRLTKGSLEDIITGLAEGAGITFANDGLHIFDTDDSHDLIISPGSNLTADRILSLVTGDAARTITLSGNPTLADWFDQALKQASSPTFAAINIGGTAVLAAINLDGTVISATAAQINKKANSEAFANNASGNPNIIDSTFNVNGTIAESTWESIGKSGAGADNTWTPLNGVPAGVDWIELTISSGGTNGGVGSGLYSRVYARKKGSAMRFGSSNMINHIADLADSSGNAYAQGVSTRKIPVDGDGVFEIYWVSNFTTISITLLLTGYGYNP